MTVGGTSDDQILWYLCERKLHNPKFKLSCICSLHTYIYTHAHKCRHTYILLEETIFSSVQSSHCCSTCVHSPNRLTPRNDGLQYAYKIWAFWPSIEDRLNNVDHLHLLEQRGFPHCPGNKAAVRKSALWLKLKIKSTCFSCCSHYSCLNLHLSLYQECCLLVQFT